MTTLRHSSRRSKRRIWIALSIVIIALIALSLIYYVRQQTSGKATVDEYFRFSNAGALAGRAGASNTSVLIQTLVFNMTPVGGDATHVALHFPGGVSAEDYYYDRISVGNSTYVEVEFKNYVQSRKQADGYPKTFRVFSDQAEGDVTLVIPEEYVIML